MTKPITITAFGFSATVHIDKVFSTQKWMVYISIAHWRFVKELGQEWWYNIYEYDNFEKIA